MVITTKTCVSFRLPDEYNLAYRYKEQHPDWKESASTNYIGFIKETTYAVDTHEEKKAHHDDAPDNQ